MDSLDWVANTIVGLPDVLVSKYDYRTDERGRRTDVVQTGSAFATPRLFKWSYNERNELVSADRHEGDDPDDPGNAMTPGEYTYEYDPIGNRLLHRVDTDASRRWYCANNVNQYTAIDDEASTCPTPSTPVAEFAYDADGNLLSDGTRQYTWDAENRLIGAAPGSPGAGAKKVAFGYDYMGRRVRKAVYAWDTGGSQWESTPMLDERYVYDGWNVVLVLDGNASNAVTRRYTWGLDLSGLAGAGAQSRDREGAVPGIHNAGGIGGLLAVVETQGTATTADDSHFWFLYDGNGNVGQLLRYAAQANPPVTLAAHYDYDPYGQTLTVHDADASGYAAANPLRFSTKWFDAETGLGYWGYRYYSPELGRWMSRDPMEEEGGLNLYGFVVNRSADRADARGLSSVEHSVVSIDTLVRRYSQAEQYEYAQIFGIPGAMVKVLNALHSIRLDRWVIGEPAYYRFWGKISLPLNARYDMVFHEGIHRYHDVAGIFSDSRSDEGVANVATLGLGIIEVFEIIEDHFKRSELDLNHINHIRSMWQNTWQRRNDVIGHYEEEYGYTWTGVDFQNTYQSLGLRFRCLTLAKTYTSLIRSHKKGRCYQFICTPATSEFEIGVIPIVKGPYMN